MGNNNVSQNQQQSLKKISIEKEKRETLFLIQELQKYEEKLDFLLLQVETRIGYAPNCAIYDDKIIDNTVCSVIYHNDLGKEKEMISHICSILIRKKEYRHREMIYSDRFEGCKSCWFDLIYYKIAFNYETYIDILHSRSYCNASIKRFICSIRIYLRLVYRKYRRRNLLFLSWKFSKESFICLLPLDLLKVILRYSLLYGDDLLIID